MNPETKVTTGTNATTLSRFLVIAFALGFALQMLAIHFGLGIAGQRILGLGMWSPSVAVLFSGAEARRRVKGALKNWGGKYLILALAAVWSVYLLRILLLTTFDFGHFSQEYFVLAPEFHRIEPVHDLKNLFLVLGTQSQGLVVFVVNLFLSLTTIAVLNGVTLAVGEEIGWRGFLQPVLEEKYGIVRSTLAVGLIWGYWHIPANLAGLNGVEAPLTTAFIGHPIALIPRSFILGWLRRESGSIWPAALSHSGFNAASALIGILVVPRSWLAGHCSAIFALAIVAGSFVFLTARHKPPNFQKPDI